MRWTRAECEKSRAAKLNTLPRKYHSRSHSMGRRDVHNGFLLALVIGVPFSSPVAKYLSLNSSCSRSTLQLYFHVLPSPPSLCRPSPCELLLYPITFSALSVAPNPQAFPSGAQIGTSPPTFVEHPPTPVASSTVYTDAVTAADNVERKTGSISAVQAVLVVLHRHGLRVLHRDAKMSVPQRKAQQRQGCRS
jgi:hypothetical protein